MNPPPPSSPYRDTLLFEGLSIVGPHVTELRDRMSIHLVSPSLRKTVPTSFIELSVDRGSVTEITKALRASRETLTTLVLSANACHTVKHCAPDEALRLEEALRTLVRPVSVTIASAVRSAENPHYDPSNCDSWMPSIFPSVNASESVICTAVLLLRCDNVASVRLPPLDLFALNLTVQSRWDLLRSLLASDPARLNFSDLLLDFYSIYAQRGTVEDPEDNEDAVDLDVTLDSFDADARRLVEALSRHAVATLSIYVDNDGFVLPPRFLRTMRISRLLIKETSEVQLDSPDFVEYATWIADNLSIRGVGLYRQGILDEAAAPFAFACAMLGNDAHAWPDGVTLFSCQHEPVPPSSRPLDATLGRLRLGTRMCLDLPNVAWEYSTILAVKRALARNPGVRHLQLTVLTVLNGVPNDAPVRAPTALPLPPNVTSVDFHMHPWSFNILFRRSAPLPGLEVLNVDLTDNVRHCGVSDKGSIARILRGAPRLRQLALSLTAGRSFAESCVSLILRAAPPSCRAVKLTVHTRDDDVSWKPEVDALVRGSDRHIDWSLNFYPNMRRRTPTLPAPVSVASIQFGNL